MTKRRSDELGLRDIDDLEEFAAIYLSMSLGANAMEPAASPSNQTPTFPHWMDSYSHLGNGAMFRAIWMRLMTAAAIFHPAPTVLVALHSPEAVICDGKSTLTPEELERVKRDAKFRPREQLDVGRRLAVYPCTATAARVRAWARLVEQGVSVDALARGLSGLSQAKRRPGPAQKFRGATFAGLFVPRGRTPSVALTAIAAEKRIAKPLESELWRQIDDEARELVRAAARAWNAAPGHREKKARAMTDRLSEVA